MPARGPAAFVGSHHSPGGCSHTSRHSRAGRWARALHWGTHEPTSDWHCLPTQAASFRSTCTERGSQEALLEDWAASCASSVAWTTPGACCPVTGLFLRAPSVGAGEGSKPQMPQGNVAAQRGSGGVGSHAGVKGDQGHGALSSLLRDSLCSGRQQVQMSRTVGWRKNVALSSPGSQGSRARLPGN